MNQGEKINQPSAVTVQEAGYKLERPPVYHRSNTETIHAYSWFNLTCMSLDRHGEKMHKGSNHLVESSPGPSSWEETVLPTKPICCPENKAIIFFVSQVYTLKLLLCFQLLEDLCNKSILLIITAAYDFFLFMLLTIASPPVLVWGLTNVKICGLIKRLTFPQSFSTSAAPDVHD